VAARKGAWAARRNAPVGVALNSSSRFCARLKFLLGFAPTSGRAQQSNERSLRVLVGGHKHAVRACMAQRFLGRVLQALDQRGQNPRSKQPRLLALGRAPAMKFLAIRQVEILQEIVFQRLRGRAHRLDRERGQAGSGGLAQRQDVDGDAVMIEFDILAVGHDRPVVRRIDGGPQPRQAPAQGRARIVRQIPEHRAKPAAAVGAGSDGEISEQTARLLRRWKLQSGPIAQHCEPAEHGYA
jgi:hypothetical protein